MGVAPFPPLNLLNLDQFKINNEINMNKKIRKLFNLHNNIKLIDLKKNIPKCTHTRYAFIVKFSNTL